MTAGNDDRTDDSIQDALDVINAKSDQLQPYFAHSQTRFVQVAKEYLRALYEGIDEINAEKQQVDGQVQAAAVRRDELAQALAGLREAASDPDLWPRQRDALQTQVDGLTRAIGTQSAQQTQLKTQWEKAKNTVQSLRSQQQLLRASMRRQEDAIRQETDLIKITEMVAAIGARADESNRQLTELSEKEREAVAAVTDLGEQMTSLDTVITRKIQQRATLVKQIRALNAKINAPDSAVDQAQRGESALAASKSHIQVLEKGLQRLSEAEDQVNEQITEVIHLLTSALVPASELTKEAVQKTPRTAVTVSTPSAPASYDNNGPQPNDLSAQNSKPQLPHPDAQTSAVNLPAGRPYLFVLSALPTKLDPVLLKYIGTLCRFLTQHHITVRILVTGYMANFVDRITRFLEEVGGAANQVAFASLFETLQSGGDPRPFNQNELPVAVPLNRGPGEANIRSGKDETVGDYRAYYRPDGSLNWIGYNVDADHYLYDYYSNDHLLLYTQIIVHQRDVSEVTYYQRDRRPVLKLQNIPDQPAVLAFSDTQTTEFASLAEFVADWLSRDQTAQDSTLVVPGDDPLCAAVTGGSLHEQVIPLLSDRTLTDPRLGAKLSGVHWLMAPSNQDIEQLQQLAGWPIPVITMDTLTSAEHATKEQDN
ncbi:hypothetical protein [Schleiferilactobacillus shenzhenensis]|uniref:Uncharacterized protein n=1 Tax=Schleiferilactobacillus shenzhenensis LY-73 TaxID=1231336 RepID=U4THS7_9LACO|nr:hypothetical protein [Schleiferilactobacillus shenzhenensis]ERL63724.1 hypothetical protein L248_2242 [Schleiferilactobacillus shenzhenensis LY-73]